MAFSSINSSDIQAGKPITQALWTQVKDNFDALNTTLVGNSQQDISGTQTLPDQTVSGTFVITDTGSTFTLPVVANNSGIFLRFIQQGNGSSTIQANGAENINGANTYVLPKIYGAATLYCDGDEWHVAYESSEVYFKNAGSASAPALALDSDPDTGFYWPSANLLGIVTEGVERFRIGTASFIPIADGTYSLGATNNTFSRIYMANGSSTQPAYTFGGETNMGIYRASAGVMAFTTAGTARFAMTPSTFRPSADNSYTLGTDSLRWSTTYSVDADFSGQVTGKTGTAASPSYSFDGNTNTGVFDSAGLLGFSVSGTERFKMGNSSFIPVADNSYNLGGTSNTWARLFMGAGAAATPSYSFGADSASGLYRAASAIFAFSVNSNPIWVTTASAFRPSPNGTIELGLSSNRWENVYSNGLNTDNVTIRHKKLTGSFSSTLGANTAVAHGLTRADIKDVVVAATASSGGTRYVGGSSTDNLVGSDAYIRVEVFSIDGTNINVRHHITGLNSQPFDIIVTYEE